LAALRITVLIEQDGREPVRLVRRIEPVDKVDFDVTKADSASFVAVPGTVTTPSVLLVQGDDPWAIKLKGDGTALALNAGGLVLVIDGTITGTTVQTDSGPTKLTGFTAGS